jgi:hypothetical protein
MFTFDTDRAILGMAIGLVFGGLIGLPMLFIAPEATAPALLVLQAAKWLLYVGLGGTILIWRRS